MKNSLSGQAWSWRRASVIAYVAWSAAGCARADRGPPNAPASMPTGAPASITSAEPEPNYRTVDEAERGLANAKATLTAPAMAGGAAPAEPGADRSTSTTSRPPPAASPADAAPVSPQVSPCANACRAFASMRRAADAVCRLAGDTDPRCGNARRTVDDSAARVSSCACSASLP